MSQIHGTTIRQISFYIVLIGLAILIYKQLATFTPSALGAFTIYILAKQPMHYLVEKRKMKRVVAALLLMLFSFIVLLLPIAWVINLLTSKIGFAIQYTNSFLNALTGYIHQLETTYSISIISQQQLQQIGSSIAQLLPQILNATFDTLAQVVMMYFILFFLLTQTFELEDWCVNNVPLKQENISLIGNELNKLVVSNAVGIPLTAILQAIVALICYWIIGVNSPFFWFAITAIFAFVPIVGAALAWIPLCIILFANGQSNKAVAVLLCGVLLIGTVDNLFRLLIQKKMGDVHPLITIFGVIVGVRLFGFMGLIFGPILISIFILLMKVYINEFNPPPPNTSEEITE